MVFVLLLICDIRLLAGSRLRALIQTVALQGVLLATLPLLLDGDGLSAIHVQSLAAAVALIKGWVIPRSLQRALRATDAHREVEPWFGFNLSLLVSLVILAASVAIGHSIALPGTHAHPLLAPVAFTTLLSGLYLVMARRQALTQVVGYLVFENGIYAFGVVVLHSQPLLVEMGVLFDLVVGILVMGLVVFQLERRLGHSDAGRLDRLRG